MSGRAAGGGAIEHHRGLSGRCPPKEEPKAEPTKDLEKEEDGWGDWGDPDEAKQPQEGKESAEGEGWGGWGDDNTDNQPAVAVDPPAVKTEAPGEPESDWGGWGEDDEPEEEKKDPEKEKKNDI